MNEIQIVKKDIQTLSTIEKKSLVLWASEIQLIQKDKSLSAKQKKYKFKEINQDIKFKHIKKIIIDMIRNYISNIKDNDSLGKRIKRAIYLSGICAGGLALAGLTAIIGGSFLSIFLISTLGSVFISTIMDKIKK